MITLAQNGKASTVKKTFSRSTEVSIDIDAPAASIWKILTNANDFARWNSTIVSLRGNIAVGEKVELVSYLDPSRTFKIKIKEMKPTSKMVWGDALGKRTYTLSDRGDGITRFTMYEKIGGLMFPLFAKKIPDFGESFEKYAADLKKEAESK